MLAVVTLVTSVVVIYSTLSSQLTPREQCQTHCSNPNPNPYPLPIHYLSYIVRPQILQQVIVVTHIILCQHFCVFAQ